MDILTDNVLLYGFKKYNSKCWLSKRAEKELNIDLKHSFLVGDKLSDIEAEG